MTKFDIRTGDVVMLRNGETGIVNMQLVMIIMPDGWIDLDSINKDMYCENSRKYDIVAVRRPIEKHECSFKAFDFKWGELVYERPQPMKLTLEEICYRLGMDVVIVQTIKDSITTTRKLCLYTYKMTVLNAVTIQND